MIISIITKYLESHKRLVVPNLGTFIVKDADNRILFSNLMKGDDGVLRSLIVEQGVSELEAAGTIDRFVFEVNFRLQRDGVCGLDKFGALKRGANGVISFIANPAAQGEVLDGGLREHIAERSTKEADNVAEQPMGGVENAAVETQPEEVEFIVTPLAQEQPVGQSKPSKQPQPNLTYSAQKRPASYVKGLQYGKGGKIITGREYATSRSTAKGDVFIKIAIAVAAVAILALLYGMWCDWNNAHYDEPPVVGEEFLEVENVAPEGVANPDLEYITPVKK
jgi:nucleoid DNA-binding protein